MVIALLVSLWHNPNSKAHCESGPSGPTAGKVCNFPPAPAQGPPHAKTSKFLLSSAQVAGGQGGMEWDRVRVQWVDQAG